MTHTPGPWGFDDNRPGLVTARGGPDICEVFGESARADECDFNHALIAAAPELLEVCKKLASDLSMVVWTNGGYRLCGSPAPLLDSLLAVIAKAEGIGVNSWDEEDEEDGRSE
jgi:hypothetical protein